MKIFYALYVPLFFLFAIPVQAQGLETSTLAWNEILDQFPGWYNTDEAINIADQVLLWQRKNGGWPVDKDMISSTKEMKSESRKTKENDDTGFKDGATYTQLQYLAKVLEMVPSAKYKKAFEEGLDYVLDAQYENGGWSLYYPNFLNWSNDNAAENNAGYTRFVTFGDSAMIGVMDLVIGVAQQESHFGFVNHGQQLAAAQSLEKAVDCVLKTQIRTDERRTGWCAQYDEQTLEPRWGRHFEPNMLSSKATADVVSLLMKVDKPMPEVIEAVQGAVFWLDEVSMRNMKVMESTGTKMYAGNASEFPAFWAHYYEIESNRPVFASDSKIYYSVTELPKEQQKNVKWYGNWADRLIAYDYPRWCKKWGIKNILE